MTDPLVLSAQPLPGGPRLLAEIVVFQPLPSAIVAFFLLYALLTLLLRLADRVEPSAGPVRAARRSDPPAPKIWRCRKAA